LYYVQQLYKLKYYDFFYIAVDFGQ